MGAPKYIKQLITNIKELIDSNTIIARGLSDTLGQMDLTDIIRTFWDEGGKLVAG